MSGECPKCFVPMTTAGCVFCQERERVSGIIVALVEAEKKASSERNELRRENDSLRSEVQALREGVERAPGKPWLVSTKEPDLWEFREGDDAGAVIFYFRGTEEQATAWARFFMGVRSALAARRERP